MGRAVVGLRASNTAGLFRGLLTSMVDPMRVAGDEVRDAMRGSIREEFAGAYWKSPSGARVPWKATQPFGSRPAGPTLGGTDGGLFRAWMGGPGGYERRTATAVTLGVSRPNAAVHRGGTGTSVNPRRRTKVRAKAIGARGLPSMFWLLGLRFRVWIRPEKLLTQGVEIPARPHATRNPNLEERLADILLRRVFS